MSQQPLPLPVPVWHERFLRVVMEWRDSRPEFTCSLRKTDHYNRLSSGYWFHGNDTYLLIGLFKPNDKKNHTPTVGFVTEFNAKTAMPKEAKIYFAFPDEENQRDANIYWDMVEACGGLREPHDVEYSIPLSNRDPIEAFKDFLEGHYPSLLAVIEKHRVRDRFLVPESDFHSAMRRIEIIKASQPATRLVTASTLESPSGIIMASTSPATNIIFYGPPGTGKTRNIQALLKAAPEDLSSAFKYQWNGTEYVDDDDKESFSDEILAEASWFSVIIAVLAEKDKPVSVSEIENHSWIRTKASLLGRTYNLSQTIWNQLGTHAVDGSITVQGNLRSALQIVGKDENSRWKIVVPDWRDQDADLAQSVSRLHRLGEATSQPVRRYEWVTFHPSFSYEEFVEGIRPSSEEGKTEFTPQDGVFKRICSRAQLHPQKRFALFIDEINRANISKVFGELITLIEPSKRIDPRDKPYTGSGVWVTLPYSGRPFGVPSNLDIYGTMNTADRSVVTLDLALRRRFQFVECPPDPSTLAGKSVGNVQLDLLLTSLNQRIEYLLDRERLLGHAYFLEAGLDRLPALQALFANRIIPLLQEYFFDDWRKISLVLSDRNGQCAFLDKSIKLDHRLIFAAKDDLLLREAKPSYRMTDPGAWTEIVFQDLYAHLLPPVSHAIAVE